MLPTDHADIRWDVLGRALEGGVATPDAFTALEHATAHPEESSSPPLKWSEAGYDRGQVADIVEHPFLPPLFRRVAAAEGVLLPSVLCARGPFGVILDSRDMLVRRRGGAGGGNITANRSERHPRNVLWVESIAAVVAHHIWQLVAEVVALGPAGGHDAV